MRNVEVWNELDAVCVKYTLITDETKTVRIPMQWWLEDRYWDMMKLILADLGMLP